MSELATSLAEERGCQDRAPRIIMRLEQSLVLPLARYFCLSAHINGDGKCVQVDVTARLAMATSFGNDLIGPAQLLGRVEWKTGQSSSKPGSRSLSRADPYRSRGLG